MAFVSLETGIWFCMCVSNLYVSLEITTINSLRVLLGHYLSTLIRPFLPTTQTGI